MNKHLLLTGKLHLKPAYHYVVTAVTYKFYCILLQYCNYAVKFNLASEIASIYYQATVVIQRKI